MQRVTIIVDDGFVAVDGRKFSGLDLSRLEPGIHAVQWFGTSGDLELKADGNGRVSNIAITDLSFCQPALDVWQAAADAEDNPPPLSPVDYADLKHKALHAACRSHITNGVVSNALGTDHTYPTQNTANHPDQQNLNGCVTESLLNDADPNWSTPFWCADANGVWDRRLHSHTQIRAVGMAVAAHVREAQNKLKLVQDQVNDIVNDTMLTDDEKRAAIKAVNW